MLMRAFDSKCFPIQIAEGPLKIISRLCDKHFLDKSSFNQNFKSCEMRQSRFFYETAHTTIPSHPNIRDKECPKTSWLKSWQDILFWNMRWYPIPVSRGTSHRNLNPWLQLNIWHKLQTSDFLFKLQTPELVIEDSQSCVYHALTHKANIAFWLKPRFYMTIYIS